MDYLILGILGIVGGIVSLLIWLWLSAERDLSKSRHEFDERQSNSRRLAASKSKLSELDEGNRAPTVAEASDSEGAAALVRLNERVADIKQELANGEAKLRELDFLLEKLTEGERMRHALGKPNARLQGQLERPDERRGASEEAALRPVSIQGQFGELLTMQRAFAEAQRRFYDALVTFESMLEAPSKAAVSTPTFEVFTGRGVEAQPLTAGNAPDSKQPQSPVDQSDAQRQRRFLSKLRDLKPPKAS